MKRAAIYARVSGDEQKDNYSLPTQIKRCRAHCQQLGWQVVMEVQEVFSGDALLERPEFAKLHQAMWQGAVDAIVFIDRDRITRGGSGDWGFLVTTCRYTRVQLECVTEPIDTSPIGEAMTFMTNWTGQHERKKIGERSLRARVTRVEQGSILPGKCPLYGYMWDDPTPGAKHRYLPDPVTAPIVRRIFAEIAAGKTMRAVARDLTADGIPTPSGGKVWAKSTLFNLLHHPAYTGQHRAFRWRHEKEAVVKGIGLVEQVVHLNERPTSEQFAVDVPPLVSPEIAEAVAARLKQNQVESARHNYNPQNALLRGGYAKCGYCGSTMTVQQGRRRAPSYVCSKNTTRSGACRGHAIATSIIDHVVWERAKAIIMQPDLIRQQVEDLQSNDPTAKAMQELNAAYQQLEAEERRLARAIAKLDNDALIDELRDVQQQKAKLEAARQNQQQQRQVWIEQQARLSDLETWCRAVGAVLDELSYDEQRQALYALGCQVTLWHADHDPRWHIVMEPTAINSVAVASELW